MRFSILILLLLMPFSISAQNVATAQAVAVKTGDKGFLIRDIRIEGFVLGDQTQFEKVFKPYRNKYLTPADMDGILNKIQVIYEREGYQQLVTITYQLIKKHRLVFTALMTS